MASRNLRCFTWMEIYTYTDTTNNTQIYTHTYTMSNLMWHIINKVAVGVRFLSQRIRKQKSNVIFDLGKREREEGRKKEIVNGNNNVKN